MDILLKWGSNTKLNSTLSDSFLQDLYASNFVLVFSIKPRVCAWMCTCLYICLSIYEAYNLYSFVRLTVYIIFQKILYQIMYHNLGSKIVIILLIPNSTGNYKAGLPGDWVVKNPPANAGDMGLIPGSGRPPGGGNGSSPQYSCLEHPMGRGAQWATIHGVTRVRHDLMTQQQIMKQQLIFLST